MDKKTKIVICIIMQATVILALILAICLKVKYDFSMVFSLGMLSIAQIFLFIFATTKLFDKK